MSMTYEQMRHEINQTSIVTESSMILKGLLMTASVGTTVLALKTRELATPESLTDFSSNTEKSK